MKLLLPTVALLANVIICAVAEREFRLSKSITNCDQQDPNLSECVKTSLQTFWPTLKDGNKEFGIPPQDPYYVSKQKITFNILEAVEGFVLLKGTKVHGVTGSKFNKIITRITEDGASFEASVRIPQVFVEGKYKAGVKINDFKMTPKGYFNMTLNDVKVEVTTSGKFRTISGARHLIIDQFDLDDLTADMKVYASSLLPDPERNNALLEVANRYMPEILRIGIPATRSQWSPVVLEAINDFLVVVPFDKLLSKRIYE